MVMACTMEMKQRSKKPLLVDTDGDGFTDFEELELLY